MKKDTQIKEILDKIEVNIVHDNKIIETMYVNIKQKTFKFEKTTYKINSKAIFLYPSKNGFVPTSFYHNGKTEPIFFKDKNEGIPARALHLLWHHGLYRVLVALEKDRTNLIIIILLLVNAILFGIRFYLQYGGSL